MMTVCERAVLRQVSHTVWAFCRTRVRGCDACSRANTSHQPLGDGAAYGAAAHSSAERVSPWRDGMLDHEVVQFGAEEFLVEPQNEQCYFAQGGESIRNLVCFGKGEIRRDARACSLFSVNSDLGTLPSKPRSSSPTNPLGLTQAAGFPKGSRKEKCRLHTSNSIDLILTPKVWPGRRTHFCGIALFDPSTSSGR